MQNYNKNNKELSITIAGITLKVIAADGVSSAIDNFKLNGSLKLFESNEKPDAVFKVNYGSLPDVKLDEEVFESGGVWHQYENEDKYIIVLSTPAVSNGDPYKIAILSKDFSEGDIYINKEIVSTENLQYPLEFPLDELITVNLLCQGRGIEVHSCGVIDNGEGILFIGVSGAGKSTLANLWKEHPEATLLSDDRIIVKKEDNGFMMYGTPWHGDAYISTAQSAPIKRVCFIVQSHENYIKEITEVDAFSRLLVRCFPTFWNEKGMDFIMQLGSEICKEIDTYEFGFLPDQTAIDFIRKK